MSTYVLIHGAWHGGWCWNKIVPLLQQAGHRVLAPDLPGHGQDTTSLSAITPQLILQSLTDLLDSESEPVILVGHSAGGLHITTLAHLRPEKINTLVYLSAYLLPPDRVPIEEGARKAGRSLADLDLLVTAGTVAFTDDLEPLLATLKVPLAFSLGAMGSRQHNFYNQVFQRAGYADLALRIQDLWLQGQRKAAIALIPDDLVLKTNLIGTKERVRERLRLYRRAGVTTLNIGAAGQTLDERLNTLGQLMDLLNEV